MERKTKSKVKEIQISNVIQLAEEVVIPNANIIPTYLKSLLSWKKSNNYVAITL